MTSTFSGISGALSALHAQRRGLDVTGQNIANVNTEGYTRQRVQLQAKGASVQPATWSTSSGIGEGVSVTDVERVRNEFLEGRGRAEHATSAYLSNQTQVYSTVENIFSEPSDTALQAQMADLWAGFDDVANHPDQSGPRGALLETAATIADGLNNAYNALSNQWSAMRTQVDAHVTDVNTTASRVATLNEAIRKANAANLPVNELADQRDGFVMRLAETAGATASVRGDGTVDVYLGSSTLVSGGNAREIDAIGSKLLGGLAADKLKVVFKDTGNAAQVGGSMGSVNDSLTTIIPGYADGLDEVAKKLADTVNGVHTVGFGLDGVGNRPMFEGTTASAITMVLTDGVQVAASGIAGDKNYDASKASALARLGSSDTGPDKEYRLMIAKLGVASQTVTRRSDIQSSITEDADAARTSESGVSLDEEMTNMLSYQRAYEAASRVISTIDSVLDVIINRMAV